MAPIPSAQCVRHRAKNYSNTKVRNLQLTQRWIAIVVDTYPQRDMTILLVEDHPDTRDAIGMWLQMQGHSVVEAHDVKSALAAASAPFDLLLCDIGLPDGDGWTLLQTLSKARSITAVAISGYCSPTDVARSKAAGFVAHLAKPFDLDEFDAAVIGSQQKRPTKTPPTRRTQAVANVRKLNPDYKQ